MKNLKKLYHDMLFSVGRIPENYNWDEAVEERKKKAMAERHYTKLAGGDDSDLEELSDEFFEDDDLDHDPSSDAVRKFYDEKQADRIYLATIVGISVAIVGSVFIIGRVLIYPIVKRLVNDDFMG